MDGFGEDLVTERSGERDLGGSEVGACFIYFNCKLVCGGPNAYTNMTYRPQCGR